VWKNAESNNTVPISARHSGDMYSTECYCSSWLFVEFFRLVVGAIESDGFLVVNIRY